jgi:hypothetical protein
MKILNRYSGEIIIKRDVNTIKQLVEIAFSHSIMLSKANLSEAIF